VINTVPVRKAYAFITVAVLCVFLAGCGRKAPPSWLEPEELPAPGAITAYYKAGGVSISWDYPDALQPFIKGYVVKAYKGGVLAGSRVTRTPDYSDSEGGVYSYRVAVVGKRKGAKAGFSPVFSSPSLKGLRAPVGLGAAMTAEGLKLSWNNMKGVDSYRIYRQIKGTGSDDRNPGTPVKSTSFVDSNPEIREGQALLYRVRAVREVHGPGVTSIAEGPVSSPLEAGEDIFRPGAPKGLDLTTSGGKVLVFWDENPEKWIHGYRIYRSAGGGGFRDIGDSKVPAFKDIPKTKGEFAYRIHAMGPGGIESPPGAVVRVSMPEGTVLK